MVGPVPAMIEEEASDALTELHRYKNLYTVKSVDAAVKMLESLLPRKVGISNGKAAKPRSSIICIGSSLMGMHFSLRIMNVNKNMM